MRNTNFKVGEEVALKTMSSYGRDKENMENWIRTGYVVKTVGRKYITVVDNCGNSIKFDKESLFEEVNCGGSDYELFHTKEEIYEDIKCKRLFNQILLCFEGYGWHRHRKFTLNQLEKIVEILNEGE